MSLKLYQSFHAHIDRQNFSALQVNDGYWRIVKFEKHIVTKRRALEYTFYPHFHPYVGALVQRLIRRSVRGLQDADTDYVPGQTITLPDGSTRPRPRLYEDFFKAMYDPAAAPPVLPEAQGAEDFQSGVFVALPHPVKDLDFSSSGAYSVYNWELFYHVPMAVALQLSKNQRFAEAQNWLHFIFDPTDDSDGPTPDRFWKVRPFHQAKIEKVEELLINLSTRQDQKLFDDTVNSIGASKDAPFRPHVVARYRQTAYMYKAIMAYLDNLIAWGDSLFSQDTGESINEAMQLYVIAANILGPRPQAVPKKGTIKAQTYNTLKAKLSDDNVFNNPLVALENDVLFDLTPPAGRPGDGERMGAISSIGSALYFCVPRNEKLLSYWDTVADRLFKIRNSLNIQGIFRQLPLFDPPIDPALLAKAAASGLDVSAVVAGLNAPLPLVRFNLLLQKAVEVCQEVKSLGGNLLSTFEKEDNETLSLLRARHEEALLGLAEGVRYAQWQEAIKNREGIEQNIENALQRHLYYEQLLGRDKDEVKLPDLPAFDKTEMLEKLKFRTGEPEVKPRDITVDISEDLGASGGRKLSSPEVEEIKKLGDARGAQDDAAVKDKIGAVLSLVPELTLAFKFWGIGGALQFGGSALSKSMSFWASFAKTDADKMTYEASNTAKMGSYSRREQEWAFQSNTIAGEITQQFKQFRAAQIREHIAEREWKNHQQQIKNSKEVRRFLEGEKLEGGARKFSTKDFYVWMKREVKGLYGQYYQFALEIARKAERALQHELGNPMLSYLQPNYLAGKEGLLAGEKLHLDLKRMEMAYLDLTRREYELTKHVSMMQVSPEALLALRTTGRCTFTVPEEAFDLDAPGHYFRRIKSVALSIPCVAGPYTGVHCTLTLSKSSIRTKTGLSDGYGRAGLEDERFSNNFSSLQSIVTSSAQNDSGLFEVNLRDERYLPFEGSGAVSEWQLELPTDFRQFDYDTISDVILHVRYTAREGGGLLKKGAVENLKTLVEEAGNIRLFSIRHEFPTEWHRFKSHPAFELKFELKEEHFPFWAKGRLNSVVKASLQWAGGNMTVTGNFNDSPTGQVTLTLADSQMEDLFLLLTWGG